MKNNIQLSKILLLASLLSLFLPGCTGDSLTLTIRFPEVAGLKQYDHLYLGKNEIGQVKKVSYTGQGDYLVEVRIKPEFKDAATVNSQFYIEQSPANTTAMAVIVEQPLPGGAILKNGSTVQGNSRTGYLNKIFKDLQIKAAQAEQELSKALGDLRKSLNTSSETLSRSLDTAINDFSLRLETFKEQFSKIPDAQELGQLEKSLRQFGEEFRKAQKEVQNHIRYELFPRFRMELDHLREQLKKQGREKEMEKIDEEARKLQMV